MVSMDMNDLDNKEYYKIKVRDFNLEEVLTCGQCFNFMELDKDFFQVIAKGKVLRIRQEEDSLIFYDTTKDEYERIWKDYFDLARDYGEIKSAIIKTSPELENVIREHSGIRILNQDFFETLISFIISQNKQIPQIKQVVRNLSEMYGTKVSDSVYLFPTVKELSENATDEGIRECKAGFRAPYILDAINKVAAGDVDEEALKHASTEEAKESLLSIKGVGEKVANCVLLFGLGRRESFPVDVWMKRIMENMYFHKDTPKEVIMDFAKEKFGDYAGYAQQYLFIYAKENKTL